jgi:PPOX class probable F420-dependent enzyme
VGVKLTDEEIDAYLEKAHTLILSTIRKSGEPFMTPIWFVWMDGAFWIGTLAKSAKIAHIKRDPRVCCMVEEGEAWIDLKAVVANCQAEIVEDADAIARFNAEMDRKYASFRVARTDMPQSAKTHYATSRVIVKMTPRPGEVRSWYNRKLRMGG